MPEPVLLRLFADCENAQQAIRINGDMENLLSAENLPAAYFSENWLHSGDEQNSSSVWNRTDGNSFLLPEVAWAELVYSAR